MVMSWPLRIATLSKGGGRHNLTLNGKNLTLNSHNLILRAR